MFTLATALYCILVSFLANSFLLIRQFPWSLYILVPVFLFVNLFAGSTIANTRHRPLRICAHGTTLLIAFCVSLVASIIFQIVLAVQMIPGNYKQYLWNLLLCVGVNAFVFWNGILCVYLTSTQLGFRLRVLGIICGMIPIANLVALYFIIKTTAEECLQETVDNTVAILRRGGSKEEAARAFKDRFYHGYIPTVYPPDAMNLNTGIMIDLIEREYMEEIA